MNPVLSSKTLGMAEESMLSEYEELFKSRYTEDDPDYKATIDKSLDSPPCLQDWFVKRNDWHQNRNDNRNRDGGYRGYDNRNRGGYRGGFRDNREGSRGGHRDNRGYDNRRYNDNRGYGDTNRGYDDRSYNRR
ncbi:hypothetical protein LOTGIDRAFT_235360 [Lottia gigantea]|uniref:RNMT-activating mini protein n=1 Tax=Lottia gigantea TaxID=225164 RepID=V3Z6X1_LOTGI|nr:hypothetical protein LOTGIDRAFT_235360 [Lottia gigantea]ESO86568.1 hypothetical protein LOTGIDRAFT_235360 [Lottia gigantea]